MTANTAQRVAVERLNELLAKARVLPWMNGEGDPESILCAADSACVAQTNTVFTDATDNALLIVAAVNALPALLLQVAEQAAEIERLEIAGVSIAAKADVYLNFSREQRTRAEAAERAREEAIAFVREASPSVMGLANLLYSDYGRIRQRESDHAEALANRMDAFLAANGPKA